jgi:hypothetical protein
MNQHRVRKSGLGLRLSLVLAIAMVAMDASTSWSQSAPIIYPSAGQSLEQQAHANEQAMAQYQADLGRYHQAFAACMQGRGYVVR